MVRFQLAKRSSSDWENGWHLHGRGSAPVIQKVQVLQKRLIAKTQECAERELAIREKDKLCPGPRAVALPPDPFVRNNHAYFLDIDESAQSQKWSMGIWLDTGEHFFIGGGGSAMNAPRFDA